MIPNYRNHSKKQLHSLIPKVPRVNQQWSIHLNPKINLQTKSRKF